MMNPVIYHINVMQEFALGPDGIMWTVQYNNALEQQADADLKTVLSV